MKKSGYATIGVICFLVLSCFMVKAQKQSKVFGVGFGLEGGEPTGNANTSYNFTGGLTIRLSYHAGPGFITLTSGVVAWLPKSNASIDPKASLQIPIKAGYKYIFHKPFFVMGEIGTSSFKIYYKDVNGKLASMSSSGFTYAPTIGVNFRALELGLKYEAISLSGGTVSNIGLRLGFNF